MACLTGSRLAWNEYYAYKKNVDKSFKLHKAKVIKERLDDASSLAAKWRVIHTVFSGRKNTGVDYRNRANDFAQIFMEKVNIVTKQMPTRFPDTDFLDYVSPVGDDESFVWPEVTDSDVENAIAKLKSKAVNFEKIAVDCIKDTVDSVSPVLTRLINNSLHTGIYPDRLKISRVLPIHKGGNPDDVSNYRPISIVSAFAKIFENVVLTLVTRYLDASNLFAETQHAFRAGHSTVSACADITEYISRAVDQHYTVGLILLDVSNAFPTVNHHILLRKMQYYGFGSTVIKWFSSYLSSRDNIIDGIGTNAHFVTEGVGVPQGSVLGPLLFNIYVNDVNSAVLKGTLSQFADDTTLIIKSKRGSDAFVKKAEIAADDLVKWFTANRLAINLRKSNFIVFGKDYKAVTYIRIGGQIVYRSDNVNMLGLRIDSNLQWASHINYVVSRIKHFRIMLFRLRYLFDVPMRIYLAKTFVFPIINLYDFIYGAANGKQLRHLNTAYNDLMRSVLGVRKSYHLRVLDMYELTGFEPLTVRRQKSLLKFMNDVNSEKVFSKLRSCFISSRHSYSTRHYHCYQIPKCNTQVGCHSISVRGLKLLNACRVDTSLSHD